ncbi:hypothetical protein GGS20DRAFT_236812 [Poronia punctata]|nr:hypothetical protein GGS20DRAFT_236812 [Poronia punctata]
MAKVYCVTVAPRASTIESAVNSSSSIGSRGLMARILAQGRGFPYDGSTEIDNTKITYSPDTPHNYGCTHRQNLLKQRLRIERSYLKRLLEWNGKPTNPTYLVSDSFSSLKETNLFVRANANQDGILYRAGPKGTKTHATCPVPSCGKALLTTADREQNLCTDCRHIFSGPYSALDADSHCDRDMEVGIPDNILTPVDSGGGRLSVDRVGLHGILPTAREGDRGTGETRRAVNKTVIVPTRLCQSWDKSKSSGLFLEPKTFASSCPRMRKSKDSTTSRPVPPSWSTKTQIGRGETPVPPYHASTSSLVHSRNRTDPTFALADKLTSSKFMSTPQWQQGQRAFDVRPNENQKIERFIEEIIDFYLRQPDTCEAVDKD